MNGIMETIQREVVYLWYYFDLQLRQILPYWALGIVIGSVVSVFGKVFLSSKIVTLLSKIFLKNSAFIPRSA